MEQKYLQLLAKEYPTIQAACSEIVNLNAIRQLPKGTEYFFSDLHGEYEAFLHLLKSASGVIRAKIKQIFDNTLSEAEQNQLANLIYEPESVLNCVELFGHHDSMEDWKRLTIYRLVLVCKEVSSKYTRSKVRKKMPPAFAYIIDELLHVNYDDGNKKVYYNEIIRSIIEIDGGDKFIIALCKLIQNLVVDNLHIIGDIFDRGPRADIIMNALVSFHDVDVQWGNHDISWMGAASGNRALMANVVRMAISYNNFDVLEDGYGINLRPLSAFAAEVYREDSCERFLPHILDENEFDTVDGDLAAKMHKAMAVIQFKLEGQILERHPEYRMADRSLLKEVDFGAGTVKVDGQIYPMLDTSFPTVDPADPLKLSRGEEDLMNAISASFDHSEVLHRHIKFLYSHGGMYKCANSNLLYHGCIPMTAEGNFDTIEFDGQKYSGKGLLDFLNGQVRAAYFLPKESPWWQDASDFMWYLWCGPKSPLFGKSKLSAFEHYFIEDEAVHKEILNPYYKLSQSEEACCRILEEFGLDPEHSHIINGHMPVKIKDGESPVKANGRLFIIDGGISKAYQSKTGIAGYTLIFNSHHLALAEHKNYMNQEQALRRDTPEVKIVERMRSRLRVADTDIGAALAAQIEDLKALVAAYKEGEIKEKIE